MKAELWSGAGEQPSSDSQPQGRMEGSSSWRPGMFPHRKGTGWSRHLAKVKNLNIKFQNLVEYQQKPLYTCQYLNLLQFFFHHLKPNLLTVMLLLLLFITLFSSSDGRTIPLSLCSS